MTYWGSVLNDEYRNDYYHSGGSNCCSTMTLQLTQCSMHLMNDSVHCTEQANSLFAIEEKDLVKAESLDSAMSSKQTLLKYTPLEHKGKESSIIFLISH